MVEGVGGVVCMGGWGGVGVGGGEAAWECLEHQIPSCISYP